MFFPISAFLPIITFFPVLAASTSSTDPFQAASQPIIDLIDMAVGPALGIVGAVGTIYCIILGAKLAKAEEPQDREKAKNALKNAIIGFVLIFVLIVAFKAAMAPLKAWMNANIKNG